jgi:hypothetical protein
MIMYTESHILYNKVKKESGLTDDALTLLGITQSKLNDAIHQCISKGMSRKVAMRTVYSLWLKANPDVQAKPATNKEMCLMGFELKDMQWVHMDYPDIIITSEQQINISFKDVEDIVLAKQNASHAPHGDNKTE